MWAFRHESQIIPDRYRFSFGRSVQHFFIVQFDSQFVGNLVTNLSSGTPILSSDSDNCRCFCHTIHAPLSYISYYTSICLIIPQNIVVKELRFSRYSPVDGWIKPRIRAWRVCPCSFGKGHFLGTVYLVAKQRIGRLTPYVPGSDGPARLPSRSLTSVYPPPSAPGISNPFQSPRNAFTRRISRPP